MKLERETFNDSVMRFCMQLAIVGPIFVGDDKLKPLISDKDYLTFKYDDEIMKVFNEHTDLQSPSERTMDIDEMLDYEEVVERYDVYFQKMLLRNKRLSH